MTILIRLLTCVFLSFMLYGEQGFVTLTLCDHDVQRHAQDQAGARQAHPEFDPSGKLPIIPCHNGMVCLCHVLAVTACPSHLAVFRSAVDVRPLPSILFIASHPLKVFRPPIL